MKKTKIIIFALIMVVLCMFATACGPGSNNPLVEKNSSTNGAEQAKPNDKESNVTNTEGTQNVLDNYISQAIDSDKTKLEQNIINVLKGENKNITEYSKFEEKVKSKLTSQGNTTTEDSQSEGKDNSSNSGSAQESGQLTQEKLESLLKEFKQNVEKAYVDSKVEKAYVDSKVKEEKVSIVWKSPDNWNTVAELDKCYRSTTDDRSDSSTILYVLLAGMALLLIVILVLVFLLRSNQKKFERFVERSDKYNKDNRRMLKECRDDLDRIENKIGKIKNTPVYYGSNSNSNAWDNMTQNNTRETYQSDNPIELWNLGKENELGRLGYEKVSISSNGSGVAIMPNPQGLFYRKDQNNKVYIIPTSQIKSPYNANIFSSYFDYSGTVQRLDSCAVFTKNMAGIYFLESKGRLS